MINRKERNIHGKIFGGYLMKEAFELAWIGAVCEVYRADNCTLLFFIVLYCAVLNNNS